MLAMILCLVTFVGCSQNDKIFHGTFITLDVSDSTILVAEMGEDGAVVDTDRYRVPNWFAPSTNIKVNDKITIYHNGEVLETDPMRFSKIQKMQYDDSETGLSVVVIAD